MTTTALIVTFLLAFCLCAQLAQGDDTCQIRGRGKLKPFSGSQVPIQMPCKYRATSLECQGYSVEVQPGLKYDGKGNIFTDTVWISIRRDGTGFRWIGRTNTKRVLRYFNDTDTRTSFVTKDKGLRNAPFSMEFRKDRNQNRVSVGVSDGSVRVDFYAFDSSKPNKKDKSGVKISCRKATFPLRESSFTESLCGNTTDSKAIRNHRKSLNVASRARTIIYDILNNERVTQTSSQCETAVRVFGNCKVDRVQVIKDCSGLLTRSGLVKCMNSYNQDAMDAFVYCLKFKCLNDKDKCDLLKDALDGCPSVPALPRGRRCP